MGCEACERMTTAKGRNEEVCIPRATVSDDRVTIVEVSVKTGAKVKAGDLLIVVETSKAANDVLAPASGVIELATACKVGAELAVGSVFATIAVAAGDRAATADCGTADHSKSEKTKSARAPVLERSPGPTEARNDQKTAPIFSRAAEGALVSHGLSKDIFPPGLHVTARDVARAAGVGPADPAVELSRDDRLVFIGGGGHCKICIEALRHESYQLLGILDHGYADRSTAEVFGIPLLSSDGDEELRELRERGVGLAVNAVGSVDDNSFRWVIYERLKSFGFRLPVLRHPNAILEPSARVGEGTQLFAGAIVGSGATIGKNCIINCGAIVSHDCVIEDNVHLAPGAILAGGVRIGKDTLVGMAATVFKGVSVGAGNVIPNGHHVFKNI